MAGAAGAAGAARGTGMHRAFARLFPRDPCVVHSCNSTVPPAKALTCFDKLGTFDEIGRKDNPMIITTADVIPGQQVQVLGLVRGNIVTSKHIGRDIMAGFKNIAGGEIKSYTDMMNEGRAVAEQRMIEEAQRLGADGIISMRYNSASVMEGTQEMLAYGTAVKFL